MPLSSSSPSSSPSRGRPRGSSNQFNGRSGSKNNYSPRGGARPAGPATRKGAAFDADHEILFQQFFKSVGPRTYVAQVKRANNGNQYLVLTEGKRDGKTDEVRKTRLFVYSEDFVEFFRLMKGLSEFIKANPVSEEVKKKRDRFWAKQAAEAKRDPPPPGKSANAPPTAGSSPVAPHAGAGAQ